jgi:GDP-L-fucose synthase
VSLRTKRILVSGGSGFLGRHVVARLLTAGYGPVFVPRSAEYDLTREADVRRLLSVHRPEIVVHLAATVGGIGANRRQPGTFAYQNLLMGAHLIEHCRRAGVQKFLLAGTTCSYPANAPVPLRECDLWTGYPEETNAPYGLAKRMLLVQLQAYRREFGLNGVTLLFANLYGPGDRFDLETGHVIPSLIRKCIEARDRGASTVEVWGTGRPTREFLYVEDAARAVLLALERYDDAEPINVGSGQEITIEELVKLIARVTGFGGDFRFDPTRPDGQLRRRLETSRAREHLGFEAATPLEAGLQRTVAWYASQRRSTPGAAAA